ncbi:hypothetical protein [Paenibacillus sp. sgz500958]|uniref:hypothetical protein n=1 Tax=Paenibacillus sp. sgz500958 TaxID=3242475 RepID=UPI0036D28A60
MIYLLTKSIIPKQLGKTLKFLLITFEFISSIMIPFSVSRLFQMIYPEHYKAAFPIGLLDLLITYCSVPIYAVVFVVINKFFKEVKASFVLYSILIILLGVGIQSGAIYVFEQPQIIDTHVHGW